MTLVKFTLYTSNEDVWINPDAVAAMYDEVDAVIIILSSSFTYRVRGSLAEVVGRLSPPLVDDGP